MSIREFKKRAKQKERFILEQITNSDGPRTEIINRYNGILMANEALFKNL